MVLALPVARFVVVFRVVFVVVDVALVLRVVLVAVFAFDPVERVVVRFGVVDLIGRSVIREYPMISVSARNNISADKQRV